MLLKHKPVSHQTCLPDVEQMKKNLKPGDIAFCEVKAVDRIYILTLEINTWIMLVEESLEMKVTRLEQEIEELKAKLANQQ